MAVPVKLSHPSVSPRSFSRRSLVRLAALSVLVVLALALGAAGCSGDLCAGHSVNGACVMCSDAQCSGGARCVQDECRASCATDDDCSAGQNCRLWGFSDGTRGRFCVVLPDAGGDSDAGVVLFTPCTGNADCDANQGLRCVSGECRVQCRSHYDCNAVGSCTAGRDSDGVAGHFCARSSEPPQAGEFYTHCPSGDECNADAGFVCIGAGTGDLDAYCTKDCTSDTDCAAGFYCGPLFRPPCTDACGLAGVPANRACIPADQIGPGLPYQCGPHGPTRQSCRPRRFCNTCETDADCLAVADQVCAADQSGEHICTRVCDPNVNSCPWGNAATCGVFDSELGQPTCAHRFGACHGTGLGCEPCTGDADCGPSGLCTGSSFTGEQWCIDTRVTCSCGGMADANGTCPGGGCPDSPGGLTMICIDDPQSSLQGACFGADTATNPLVSSPQTGCWPKL